MFALSPGEARACQDDSRAENLLLGRAGTPGRPLRPCAFGRAYAIDGVTNVNASVIPHRCAAHGSPRTMRPGRVEADHRSGMTCDSL